MATNEPTSPAPSRSGFWIGATVVAVALWASAAPTITYPLYANEWHLTAAETTAMFATFPVVLAIVLTLFGDLADHIGRRNTILVGLAASFLSGLLFTIATESIVIFLARALTGIGVALTMGPASAEIVEAAGPGASRRRASAVTTAATAVGLGLAVLVSGVLIDVAPLPTHLSFGVFTLVVAVVAGTTLRLPRHTAAETKQRWRLRGPRIPKGLGTAFSAGALPVTAGFTIGAVVLSLGADIARVLIGSDDAIVGAVVIAAFAIVMGATAITVGTLPPKRTITVGAIAGFMSLGLLAAAGQLRSLPLLGGFAVVAGVAYALLFAGGLRVVNASAPAHHRAGVISVTYLIAYLAQAVTALALGALTTATSLGTAIDVGAVVIAVLVVTAALTARTSMRRGLVLP